MGRTSDAQDRLVEHAAALWYSRSYADVGVNEICEASGVRKGSFYHFFPSKRDLALAVIDAHWRRFGGEILAPILDADAPPLERLDMLTERGAEVMQAQKDEAGVVMGCPFGNLAVELSTIDEVVRARLEELFEERVATVRGLLDEAVIEGELPQETDTQLVAQAINAYYEGVLAMSKTSGDPDALRRLGPLARRLAGAGVEAPAAAT